MDAVIVDLFAGPGGWDIAAAELGMNPVGFEFNAGACSTRTAAGLTTVRADLAGYRLPASAQVEGLIGSPPCPLFSAAGKREGVDWLPHLCKVAAGLDALSSDAPPDAALSLVPLEWALRHRPRWVCLEQVPAVVLLWGAVAGRLRSEGYSTWTGVLNAADYGVPQTRQRAFMIASLDVPASPPEPTHARHPEPTLFGNELRPWVSMADALKHQSVMVKLGGRWLLRHRKGAGCVERHGEGPPRGMYEPAHTITAGANRRMEWIHERPATTIQGDPRVAPPGHRDRAGGEPQFCDGTIRLTVAQAAALQSFPADYPWQGSKTAQFAQIGNALPPLLARHVLTQVTYPQSKDLTDDVA